MAASHKKQHTIPCSYLKNWIEPVTPTGQKAAIHLVSREDRTVRRKSPEKSFTETDRYTIYLKDGTRDLTIEHYLGGIENDFQDVVQALRRERRLTLIQRARLCAFTAAMVGRSKKQGDWMLKQHSKHLDLVLEMERSVGAEPTTSRDMQELLQSHHGRMVADTIEIVAPLLVQMKLSILTTDNSIGFITSDAPAVIYNPKAHTLPPLYRSPGLAQRAVEITLPLTPKHLAFFSHQLYRPYIALQDSALDEVNRTTLFFCDKEIVSRTGEIRDYWFSEREEPADAWKPNADTSSASDA